MTTENMKNLEKCLMRKELYWNLPVQYYTLKDFLELLHSYHIVEIGKPYNEDFFDLNDSSPEVLAEIITNMYNNPNFSHYTETGFVVIEKIPKSNKASYLAKAKLRKLDWKDSNMSNDSEDDILQQIIKY